MGERDHYVEKVGCARSTCGKSWVCEINLWKTLGLLDHSVEKIWLAGSQHHQLHVSAFCVPGDPVNDPVTRILRSGQPAR